VSTARSQLFRVYAAIDRLSPRDPDGALLEQDLRELGVDVDELGDVSEEFKRFADAIGAERAGDTESAPLPLVRVVETTMDVVAVAGEAVFEDVFAAALQTIARHVVVPELADDEASVEQVVEALRSEGVRGVVTDEDRTKDRWPVLQRELANRIPSPDALVTEVSLVVSSTCDDDLFSVEIEPGDTEVGTIITTTFEIQRGTYDMDMMARACIPTSWPACNDFFRAVVQTPERDGECPGTTPGAPRSSLDFWCNVFKETVGTDLSPDWFPDTYLLFTWNRHAVSKDLILRYQLAPKRPGDRTVLHVDEGFIQVNEFSTGFEVHTQKKLLFNDNFLPSGGQALARHACVIGWMDHSLVQFTTCAERLPDD
jgi:protein involved in ribonucleotide reduction